MHKKEEKSCRKEAVHEKDVDFFHCKSPVLGSKKWIFSGDADTKVTKSSDGIIGKKRSFSYNDDIKTTRSSDVIIRKKRVYMKGASQLDAKEKKFYDTKVILDPNARASKKMSKARGSTPSSVGDGDVWVEKIFRNRETGETRIFFVSKLTGKKVKFEPPTGASRVMYLRQAYKSENEMKASSLVISPDSKSEGNVTNPISSGNHKFSTCLRGHASPYNFEGKEQPSSSQNYSTCVRGRTSPGDFEVRKQLFCGVSCKSLDDQTIPTHKPPL